MQINKYSKLTKMKSSPKKYKLIQKFFILILVIISWFILYKYFAFSHLNYIHNKNQAQKLVKIALIMRTETSISEADKAINNLTSTDKKKLEAKINELNTAIQLRDKTGELVTLAETFKTHNNYSRAQEFVNKLNYTIMSKDKEVFQLRLNKIKNSKEYKIPND